MGAVESAPDPASGLPFARRHLPALLVLAAYVAVALAARPRPMVDDAAIVFRYAENLAAGAGIRYNRDGPATYGASALPYLAVLTLLNLAGAPLETAALALNLACVCAAGLLVVALLSPRSGSDTSGLSPPAAAAVLAFALFQPQVLLWPTQGLESGLHLLLGIATVWAYERGNLAASGVLLGAAVADKLDAAALGLALVVVHVAHHRRLPGRLIAGAAIVLVPWFTATSLYFGDPLPLSLRSKLLREFATPGAEILRYYAGRAPAVLIAAAAPFALRRPFPLVLAAWLAAHVALYAVVARGFVFGWYLFASDFVVGVLAGMVLMRMATGCRRPLRMAAALALAALALAQLTQARAVLAEQRRWAGSIEQDRVEIGAWLGEVAAPGESVASGHGWIQYLSRLKVYDYSGINDREWIDLKRAGREPEYLLRHRPDYLVGHALQPGPELAGEYRLIAVFARTERETGWPEWRVWGRLDSRAVRTGARPPPAGRPPDSGPDQRPGASPR